MKLKNMPICGETVKREREVAEGVNKRDSRKMKREERAANVYL